MHRIKPAPFLFLLAATARFANGATCDQLRDLTLPGAKVTAENASDPDGRSYCRVLITSTPVADSEIHSEVWLPATENWNGKLLGTGNGGYSSQIDVRAMRTAISQGYAVTGSDTGHSGGDLKFGAGHPAKIDDWAYRAVHVMTEAAKIVLRSYYGRLPEHAYFTGCSTGGQQALSEAQRYPLDYDGIVAGDPGNDRIHLNIGFLWSWRALHQTPESNLPKAKLPTLYRAVMEACDASDGVKDGILSNPRRCRFDPATLLCQGPDSNACLTAPQVKAVRDIYAGARNPRTGERIFPGWVPGSEDVPDAGSWAGYFVDMPEPARVDFWRYWVFADPHWDPRSFDFDRDVTLADRTLPQVNALDPNLTAFKRSGGKLLLYQGWADPVVPPEDTLRYYEAVARAMGGAKAVDSFALLFMVPGMAHCSGGPGPNRFDSLRALDRWVVSGRAPASIVAEHQTRTGAVDRSRPLCPHPQQAVYKGTGSTDAATSFVCSADTPHGARTK